MVKQRLAIGGWVFGCAALVGVGSADAVGFDELFDSPAWSDNQAIQGNNGWTGSAGTIQEGGWGVTPVSGDGHAFHRVVTTAVVDSRLYHDIAAEPTTDPFTASVYLAHDIELLEGAAAGTRVGFFSGGDSNYYKGVLVGIKSDGGVLYLFAHDGVSDTDTLIDADPNASGINPVSGLTWYRFDISVQPGAPHSTYDVSVYDLADNLLGQAQDMTTRNDVSGQSFDQVVFSIYNTNSGTSKDVRGYYDSLEVMAVPEPASAALIALCLCGRVGRGGQADRTARRLIGNPRDVWAQASR